MAETYTSNLGLVKPDYDSPADISVINSNMDKIDNAVANAGKVKSVNGKTGDVVIDDVSKLNGKSADQYMLKTDTAADSDKLGGVAASDYYNRDNLVFDDAPVEGSTNPITSGAVHSAMASVSTEFKRAEKGDITHTLGTGVTAYNLEFRRRDNAGLLSAYFKFESTIANAGVVATITTPEGFELESIQPSSLSKGASNSTISSIGASVSDGVITLAANGDISVDNYVRHNWVVFYK